MRDNTFWAMCVSMVIVFFLGIYIGNNAGIAEKKVALTYDTITSTIYDTTHVVQPIYKYETLLRYDTIRCYREEIVEHLVTDTVPLYYIPITQKYYSDKKYEVWISGHNHCLDSINVFTETIIQNVRFKEPTKQKRWGLGIQAGATYDHGIQPYIGVGISYNILQW